jgi:hypothetical protein
MALSYALRQLERYEIPTSGPWMQAERIVHAYQERAWRYQNSNGSFSTQFFNGSGRDADLMRRIYTTGHILEWLAYSLADSELTDPRLTAAVDYLVDTLLTAPNHEVDVGPRGHALHALAMYYERAYGMPVKIGPLERIAASIPAAELQAAIAKDSTVRIETKSAPAQATESNAPVRSGGSRPFFRRR